MKISADLKGLDDIKSFLARLPNQLFPYIKAEFQRTTLTIQKKMVERVSNGVLARRTGNLARRFKTKAGGTNLNDLYAEVSNDAPYAAIHEFGGIIKAKSTRYLTIPLDADKTKAGASRASISQFISKGKTFFKQSRRGNLILFRNEGNGNLTPLFVLKKQVSIPARLGFYETAQTYMDDLIQVLDRLVNRLN